MLVPDRLRRIINTTEHTHTRDLMVEFINFSSLTDIARSGRETVDAVPGVQRLSVSA
jgi:hypothetical protein